MFVAPVLSFKSSFYIFLTVSYPHDLYCLKAMSELFGRWHIALFVLEFPIVKQRNGYPDVPMHMLPLNK